MRVVIDTSVMVAASRSRHGASFQVVQSISSGLFQPCLSVALYAEWRDALSRPENRPPGVSAEDAWAFLRYVAGLSHIQPIYFLWRPVLRDPDDDMVLELAVAASCRVIVTHNLNDFVGAERFGINPVSPAEFLRELRGPS